MDNEIVELQPNAAPTIRFKCVSAKATPAAVDELCLVYRHAIDQDHMIRHLLQRLKGKKVECVGRGHTAKWRRIPIR